MKTPATNKYKLYPYAISVKKPTQQWNHLLKLSSQKKRLYKNKTRFFSMELGRSLSKRIFWQIAEMGSYENKHFKLNQTFHSKVDFNTNPVLLKCKEFENFQQNWTIFRSLFFGKMWMLNNPSLVPGIVWPVKSKKILVAKMRAFKALCHLTGKGNFNFVLRNVQKLWASTTPTKPFLWFLASSMDSLKANCLMKNGFVSTIQKGHHWVSYGKTHLNGYKHNKSLSFYYPGDFIQINKTNSFSMFFNSGPRFQSLPSSKKNLNSIYSGKIFQWTIPFFQDKKSSFFVRKKELFAQSAKANVFNKYKKVLK